MKNPVAMDQVEVMGVRISYRRAGEGQPPVLLHGGDSDSREWRHQLAGLSDEFTVVAWDMPGCGQSGDPPESFFRLRHYTDCLASFMNILGLRRPSSGCPWAVGLLWSSTAGIRWFRRP